MSAQMNLAGQKFGNWTALEYTRENGRTYYRCRCKCGTERLVSHSGLRSGSSKGCGCNLTGINANGATHGMRHTKVYASWCHIKHRCYNPANVFYKHYGGKGILMDEGFKEDFLKFYEEIGNPPDESCRWSVDRIDNDSGYIKGNIRWATESQQAQNKGKSVNNSSGVTGVSFYWSGIGNQTTYVTAAWNDNGCKSKRFSVKKYGLLPAFKEAVIYREKKIVTLNNNGAEYSEKHGK